MNATDVDFVLTAEDFETYEKRLADCGIKVHPMARETVENLEKGGISHVTISGILTSGGAEYIYHVSKYPNTCHLTVDAFAHDKIRGKALLIDLRHIFPQPERPDIIQVAPSDPHKKRDISNAIGCLVVLAFIGALIFFAIMGFKSVFWK